MNTKHTPAPWEILEMPDRLIIKNEELNLPIGDVYGVKSMTVYNKEQVRANAKLIAAAPELLEALQNLENDNNAIPPHAWDKVQKAIKKATE